MDSVPINGHQVTASSQRPRGAQYASDASASDYILIHCKEYPTKEEVQQLQKLHVELLDLVAENTYICHFAPKDLSPVRRLPFIHYANVYHPDLVLQPHVWEEVRATSETDNQDVPWYRLTLHDHDDPQAAIRELAAAAHVTTSSILPVRPGSISMQIAPTKMNAVARIDKVRNIEPILKHTLHIEKARGTLHYVAPGQVNAFLGGFRPSQGGALSESDLGGEGQIVAVADTGFDLGSAEPKKVHPALKGRIEKMFDYSVAGDFKDKSGHGTHVAGCIAGMLNSQDFGPVAGTAPNARLIICAMQGDQEDGLNWTSNTNLMDGSRKIGGTYIERLQLPFQTTPNPCRVMNASQGLQMQLVDPNSFKYRQRDYDTSAEDADALVNENQDWVFCFSAGNQGYVATDTGSMVGSQAAAKNVITIGACESEKRMTRTLYSDKYKSAIVRKFTTDVSLPIRNPDEVADFSNFGPTIQGRTKPDVVAPGTLIYSARSQWKGVLGTEGLSIAKMDWIKWLKLSKYDYNQNGVVQDERMWFMSGTSMAAPLVAGCCAVLRRVFCQMKGRYPSAAMVKALLVNGADVNDSLSTRTNRKGFGRVNMTNSLLSLRDDELGGCWDSTAFNDGYDSKPNIRLYGDALRESETRAWQVDVNRILGKTATLSATLAYPDKLGKMLLKEVGLEVWDPNGQVERAEQDPADATKHKVKNNVQKVIVRDALTGTYTIKIRCVRIDHTAQRPEYENRVHAAVVWTVIHTPHDDMD